jgi:hypothetical protein
MSKTARLPPVAVQIAAADRADGGRAKPGLLEPLGPLLIQCCYPKSHKTIYLVVNVLRVPISKHMGAYVQAFKT